MHRSLVSKRNKTALESKNERFYKMTEVPLVKISRQQSPRFPN